MVDLIDGASLLLAGFDDEGFETRLREVAARGGRHLPAIERLDSTRQVEAFLNREPASVLAFGPGMAPSAVLRFLEDLDERSLYQRPSVVLIGDYDPVALQSLVQDDRLFFYSPEALSATETAQILVAGFADYHDQLMLELAALGRSQDPRVIARRKMLMTAETLLSTPDLASFEDPVLETLDALIGFDSGRLWIYDVIHRTLRSAGAEALEISAIAGLSSFVARTGEALRLDDAPRDPRHDPDADGVEERFLALPVAGPEDRVLGVLSIGRAAPAPAFSEREEDLARQMAQHLAPILALRAPQPFATLQQRFGRAIFGPNIFREEAIEANASGFREQGRILRNSVAESRWTRAIQLTGSLAQRFSALGKLRWLGGRDVPLVRQTTNADCGAACLAMVLAGYGKKIPLEEVRQVAGVGRDGSNAYNLLRAGRYYGLSGRGIKIESVEDLRSLPKGTILHWRFHHFVVFEALIGEDVQVLDPGLGRRRVPSAEVSRSLTGVGLTFEPSEEFFPEDRRARGTWRYVRRLFTASRELLRVVALSLFLQVLALAVPFLTGTLIDRVLPTGDTHLLLMLALGTVVVAFYRFLSAFLRGRLLLQMRTRLDAQMTLEFLEHLVALPYSFFSQRSAGDLITRINSNTMVREILTSSALSACLDGFLVTLYLVLLLAISPTLGAVALLLGLLRLVVFALTRRRYRDLMAEQLHVQAAARGYQVQMLAGIETLKASGAENHSVGYWSDLFVDELNTNLEQGRLQNRIDALLDVLTMVSPLIVLLVGGQLVLSGALSLGTMLAMSALATGFLLPLSTLMTTAFDLQRLGSYLERIAEVFDTPKEQALRDTSPPGKLSGRIQVEEVSFRYAPLAPLVAREISIDVAAGEFIGIVGRSGSGKSTLASLLFGLYPPTTGRILYDGTDLQQLDLQRVRQQLGIVTQHPFLFGTSIRRNIALSEPDAPLSRVIEAAREAEIHDDVLAMPMGYDSVLADGGASLSGGQRQRLALARALFRRPRILLLDEATSALDTVTERKIYDRLKQMRATRVVVAHRLSTVRDADRILVLDEGRLVEEGDHETLLRRGGLYSELVASQEIRQARGVEP